MEGSSRYPERASEWEQVVGLAVKASEYQIQQSVDASIQAISVRLTRLEQSHEAERRERETWLKMLVVIGPLLTGLLFAILPGWMQAGIEAGRSGLERQMDVVQKQVDRLEARQDQRVTGPKLLAPQLPAAATSKQ